ncbi:hypothetical protein MYCTH_2310595 [Thermothelomyces thermophilus ATCC 42464]|uniref:Uncharacterized protein n=1 Tax=Thermothelomyces thermophilus (strain ATCC 42464 / BCRC 31852 / DSM 1799) TaxID=573729 RepID=G2QLQ7_THET4|nr:uncharacterized protein MYCTH_2310595 [Thermothelomyces thermophilus ATCC 42464]AEO60887.1 hypothetical protein MYCTH_2310595 [Thermothelomyces thermophilus ATCC 42464]
MSSWELQDGQNVVVGRQNTAPCPNGNGTTIGTAQEFTVLCNTRLAGDVLDRFEASSSWRQGTASRARGRTMTGIGNSP